MTIDDLTKTTGEWLRGVGPDSDVVISSRVRLARNLADYPFLSTASADERTEVYRSLSDEITSKTEWADAIFVDLEETDELDSLILVERHLISRQHAAPNAKPAMLIKEYPLCLNKFRMAIFI